MTRTTEGGAHPENWSSAVLHFAAIEAAECKERRRVDAINEWQAGGGGGGGGGYPGKAHEVMEIKFISEHKSVPKINIRGKEIKKNVLTSYTEAP